MAATTGVTDFNAVGMRLVEEAAAATSGRATHVVHAGGRLAHVLLALRAEAALSDHENPGEATLQVLVGRIRLTAGDEAWELAAGEVVVIPQQRHALTALHDSLVVLTISRNQ